MLKSRPEELSLLTLRITPLLMVLLSAVSLTCGQSWYENIKWKIPEMNNS